VRILHVGCGRKQLPASDLLASVGLHIDEPLLPPVVWNLDADGRLHPDLTYRLGDLDAPLPLADDSIDLVIAWHVLEHVGHQGEAAEWFRCWEELYRVLTPGGWLYAECPHYDSVWAWGDPTHTRAMSAEALYFFAQDSYRIPGNMISPYRIRCDFVPMALNGMPDGVAVLPDPTNPRHASLRFAVRAVKPLRPWWET